MNRPHRIYLDTNIFIYALEEKSPRSDLLTQLFAVHDVEQPFLVTSELALAELLVRPYQTRNDGMVDAYDGLIRSSAWLEVRQVKRRTNIYAAILRAENRKIRLPDALHLASAIEAECTYFMTADKGLGPEYRLDTVRDETTGEAARLDIIRPDDSTLMRLLENHSR